MFGNTVTTPHFNQYKLTDIRSDTAGKLTFANKDLNAGVIWYFEPIEELTWGQNTI